MRIIALLAALALLACGGSSATQRDDGAGGGDRNPAARHCPVPAGARLVDEAALDPAQVEPITVQAWDELPPSDQPRLIEIVVPEQPSLMLNYLAEQDGTLLVGVAGHTYCGGAYPPPGRVQVKLPAHGGAIEIRPCFYTERECSPYLP